MGQVGVAGHVGLVRGEGWLAGPVGGEGLAGWVCWCAGMCRSVRTPERLGIFAE